MNMTMQDGAEMDRIDGVMCGTLIDGTGKEPRHDVFVHLEGDKVASVGGPRSQSRPGGQVVDARKLTVLPGLIDVHVHLANGVRDPQEPNVLLAIINSPPPLLVFHAARNARRMLQAGFTTIRDMGGVLNPHNVEGVCLRRAIDLGLTMGPRLFAAGWVGATAGHFDLFLPPTYPRDESDRADGVDEVRKLTRRMIREGVDLIKTASGGGLGGYGEEKWWRNYTIDEISAIADEAHAVGKKLAVHTYTAQGIKSALLGGADTIEHGTDLDDEGIELMIERGAFLVPTFSVRSERALSGIARGGVHAHLAQKHKDALHRGADNFRRAYERGVRIAMGTDTGRSLREFFGENAFELELMVRFGMSPMDAIVASTGGAAEALGQDNALGTVLPGKFADMAIIDGDPLQDIRVLQDKRRIVGVVKGAVLVTDRDVRFLNAQT